MNEPAKPGRVVPRDTARFARLHPEGRPVMPPGYSAPLDTRPIRVLIREAGLARAAGA